jgi:transcriptional antiterminator
MWLLSQLFKKLPDFPEPSAEYLKMLELAKEFEYIVLNWMDSYCYYLNINRHTVIDDRTGKETYQVFADENDNHRAHPDLVAEIYVDDKNRVVVYVEVKSKKLL